MIPETEYHRPHAIADQIVTSFLETQPPGLALSIDIGASFLDFVLENAARTTGHQFVRAPSLVRYRAHLRARALPIRPVDVLAGPILFGRVDGVTRRNSDHALIAVYAPRFEELATRTIDGWRIGRPTLRLLHFGDPELVLEQMAGATATLAADRPAVTLYPPADDRDTLIALLDEHGYRAIGLSGRPVRNSDERSAMDFAWLALPEERADLFDDALIAPTEPLSAQQTALQQAIDLNALPRQRRSRALFGLSASASLPLARTIDAPAIVAEHDCYPLETDGKHSWRWFGPRPRTRLAVPCSVPGLHNIQIAVLDSHLQSGLEACRVIVEGREVAASVEGDRSGTIRFTGQREAGNYAGYMEVDIVTAGAVHSATSDPRTLRLCVQSIAVTPWH